MVQIKRKVTLKTKVEQDESTPINSKKEQPNVPIVTIKHKVTIKEKKPEKPTISGRPNKSNKSKYIAAAIVGILALGGGGYYLSQQGGEKRATEEITKTPEVPDKEQTKPVNEPEVEGEAKDNGKSGSDETKDVEGAQLGNQTVPDKPSQQPQNASTTQPTNGNEEQNGEGSQANPKTTNESTTDAPINKPASTNQNQPSSNSEITNNGISSSTTMGSIDEEAKNVIRGKYGNNPVRRQMLGNRYAEIQRKVNEIYKNKSRKRRHH